MLISGAAKTKERSTTYNSFFFSKALLFFASTERTDIDTASKYLRTIPVWRNLMNWNVEVSLNVKKNVVINGRDEIELYYLIMRIITFMIYIWLRFCMLNKLVIRTVCYCYS